MTAAPGHTLNPRIRLKYVFQDIFFECSLGCWNDVLHEMTWSVFEKATFSYVIAMKINDWPPSTPGASDQVGTNQPGTNQPGWDGKLTSIKVPPV